MNIGILGTGGIARKMATTLNAMPDMTCLAVGSRNRSTADAFAGEFGITRAYGSYEALANDGEIDLVYVATPHPYHCENALLCLNAGRNVLVEKPFAVNAKQAREMLDLGREKNLLAAEAIWTRYLPLREKFALISDGSIGKPLFLSVNLCYPIEGTQRLYDPSLAGGALLDLGVYLVNFALMAFGGDIKEVRSSCQKAQTGVDRRNEITFIYNDGKIAKLWSSMAEAGDSLGIVEGDKGRLIFGNINNYEWVELQNEDGVTRFEQPEQITGFEYQVRACAEAIAQGLTACAAMPRSEILRVAEIMDGIREQWGLRYPFE